MRKAIATGIIATVFCVLGGCASSTRIDSSQCPPGQTMQPAAQAEALPSGYANPMFIPLADSQCAWETVVDVVDDYFRIEHEEPVRMAGTTLLEGNITTAFEISPTIFEPWRHDTVDRQQRIENTLQTMRRRAIVRVIPTQGGHLVDVAVYKELEDMLKPEHATAGAATFRYDSSLTGIVNPVMGEQIDAGWIGRGRDAAMEQYMIADLVSRCGKAVQPAVMRGQDQ